MGGDKDSGKGTFVRVVSLLEEGVAPFERWCWDSPAVLKALST